MPVAITLASANIQLPHHHPSYQDVFGVRNIPLKIGREAGRVKYRTVPKTRGAINNAKLLMVNTHFKHNLREVLVARCFPAFSAAELSSRQVVPCRLPAASIRAAARWLGKRRLAGRVCSGRRKILLVCFHAVCRVLQAWRNINATRPCACCTGECFS